MSGFYTIGWCIWSVWAVVTVFAACVGARNFKSAETRRQRVGAWGVLVIASVEVVHLAITAYAPLPPDPVQLLRLIPGRSGSILIAATIAFIALYDDKAIAESEARHRQQKRVEEVGG